MQKETLDKFDKEIQTRYPIYNYVNYIIIAVVILFCILDYYRRTDFIASSPVWFALISLLSATLLKHGHLSVRKIYPGYKRLRSAKNAELVRIYPRVVACPYCNTKLRVSGGISIQVKCPTCKKKFLNE